jgi:hypothetical protein
MFGVCCWIHKCDIILELAARQFVACSWHARGNRRLIVEVLSRSQLVKLTCISDPTPAYAQLVNPSFRRQLYATCGYPLPLDTINNAHHKKHTQLRLLVRKRMQICESCRFSSLVAESG